MVHHTAKDPGIERILFSSSPNALICLDVIRRDGLGAVIKTLLRRMELNKDFPGHVYIDTVEDAFLFLASHYSGINGEDESDWYGEQRKFLDDSVTEMKFHLFKVPVKDMEEGVAQYWSDGGKYSIESEKVGSMSVCHSCPLSPQCYTFVSRLRVTDT